MIFSPYYSIMFAFIALLFLSSDDNDDKDDVLSAMEESSLSESEDDEIISSIRPSQKVIYSSESDKPSDGNCFQLFTVVIHYLSSVLVV